jgi:hypothetical protein
MLSAPPVLVEPKHMKMKGEASPIAQEHFEWATQTPEPSPLCPQKEPSNPEHLSSLQNICSLSLEQMLARVGDHVDILGAAEPAARYYLIQTLCQPFFDHVVEQLYAELSRADDSAAKLAWQPVANDQITDGSLIASSRQRLGVLEEDSTDADDTPFATLFSSDGEECEAEHSRGVYGASRKMEIDTICAASDRESDSPLELEKSQMVCRHWKSKGWCRYETQCKFSHPENKRGISARGPADRSDCPRRRGGKNKKSVDALDSTSYFANPCEMYLLGAYTLSQDMHPQSN